VSEHPPPFPCLPYKVDTSRPSLRTNWTLWAAPAYHRDGKPGLALEWLRRAVAVRSARQGPLHPDLLAPLGAVASLQAPAPCPPTRLHAHIRFCAPLCCAAALGLTARQPGRAKTPPEKHAAPPCVPVTPAREQCALGQLFASADTARRAVRIAAGAFGCAAPPARAPEARRRDTHKGETRTKERHARLCQPLRREARRPARPADRPRGAGLRRRTHVATARALADLALACFPVRVRELERCAPSVPCLGRPRPDLLRGLPATLRVGRINFMPKVVRHRTVTDMGRGGGGAGCSRGGDGTGARGGRVRLVVWAPPPPVLIGHAASFTPYSSDTPRPSFRRQHVRLVALERRSEVLELRRARAERAAEDAAVAYGLSKKQVLRRPPPPSPPPPFVLIGHAASFPPY